MIKFEPKPLKLDHALVFKCPCGDAICKKWMVSPGADRQGAGFYSYELAVAVAKTIDAHGGDDD